MEVLKGLVFAYDVVTFPVYFAAQRPWTKKRKAKMARAAQINPADPYSPWVRIGKAPSCLADKCSTLDELFKTAVNQYRDQKCFGVRQVLMEEDETQPDGKVFTKKTLADTYSWYTFSQIDKRIDDLTRGLMLLGIKSGDKVIIFMETRMEWMLMAQAIFRVGATLATCYATLGDEGVSLVVNEVEATHLLTSSDLLPKLRKMSDKLPTLKHIVYVEAKPEKSKAKDVDYSDGFPEDVKLTSFDDAEMSGRQASPSLKGTPPKTDDIALVMYTSGSTGAPKGVMTTHKSVIAAIKALNTIIDQMNVKRDDTYIGYLPLAHNLEFTAEHLNLTLGVPVGYSSPQTLTDKSAGIKAGDRGDANILKPGALAGVPLILDRIRKGITEQVEGRGKRAKNVFNFAIDYKNYWAAKGYDTPILNRIICKKIKASLGGNIKYMFCGGAPLSPDTQAFAKACMDIKLLQGFGCTETTAICSLMDTKDNSTGRTGAPLFGAKVRLVDWAEGNYKATDRPRPRGEVVVGGDFIAQGYFKRDEETKEVFKEEKGTRWFYTGDIGEIYPDGTIKIIDRKKDLVKLQFGEYISLGKVEAELKSCSYVDNICICADSTQNFLVALVSPNKNAINQLARHLQIGEGLSFASLAADPEVQAEVLKAIAEHGFKAGLQKFEIPRKIKLCKEEWSPDTGLVTAAMKIRRKPIAEFYQTDINKMYGIFDPNMNNRKKDMNSNAITANGNNNAMKDANKTVVKVEDEKMTMKMETKSEDSSEMMEMAEEKMMGSDNPAFESAEEELKDSPPRVTSLPIEEVKKEPMVVDSDKKMSNGKKKTRKMRTKRSDGSASGSSTSSSSSSSDDETQTSPL